MKTRFITILIILVLFSLACSLGSSGEETVQPSNVLFEDDFSDTSSGWDRVDEPEQTTDYADGVYRILVNEENTDVWANPGLSYNDVRIEVDATKVGGSDDNDFGVICRYQDVENFYYFVISSDGYYGIFKTVNGEQMIIGTENMPESDAIKLGNTTNHLRAECVGNKLSMYANGVKLDEFEDTDFTSGDVGLIAGTYDTPGTEIRFDNFKVLKP